MRKVVALALSAWLFLLGCSYAPAFSAEIQHDLEYVQTDADGSPQGNGACGHGCSGHFFAHLVAILDGRAARLPQPRRTSLLSPPNAVGASLASDPFFPPPKFFLSA